MGILFVGDIHLGCGSYPVGPDGLSFRDRDFLRSLDIAFDNPVDHIVFLGDIYDSFRPTNELRSEFNKRIKQELDQGRSITILLGNHDMNSKGNALMPLAKSGAKITLVDKPRYIVLEQEGVNLYCIPWSVKAAKNWSKSFDRVLKMAQAQWPRTCGERQGIIVGHLPILGGRVGPSNYRLDASGVSLNQLAELAGLIGEGTVGLFGHYHQNQRLPTKNAQMWYVGALDRIDFGERKEDKVVVVYDGESFKQVTIPVRKMVQLGMGEVERLKAGKVRGLGIKGAIVKVKLDCDKEFAVSLDRKALRESVLDAGAEWVAPLEINVSTSKEKPAETEGYRGSLGSAVATFVQEKYSKLKKRGRAELIEEAAEILQETKA